MGTMNHLHTKQMGFQAAQRLQMAKALGGSGGAPMAAPVGAIRPPMPPQAPAGMQPPMPPQAPQSGDFRQHVAQASGLPGVSAPEVHQAIGALAQAGQFNPIQAHALVAHQGPLQGQAGAQTVGKIAQAVKMLRARRAGAGGPPGMGMPQPGAMRPPMQPQGMPTNGPVAGGGMPAGMGP